MSKTAWITEPELATYLAALGVARPAGVTLTDVIAAVVSEWERRTGWSPFVAESTASVATFAATDGNGILRLPSGYTSITSITVDGLAMTSGLDYAVWPETQTPISRVQFRGCVQTAPPSIVVTGKRGWGATIPDDVWQAVRARAAYAVNAMASEINGNLIGVRQGSVQINYSVTGRGVMNQFETAVNRYRRVD